MHRNPWGFVVKRTSFLRPISLADSYYKHDDTSERATALSAHAVIEVGPRLGIVQLETHRSAADNSAAVSRWNGQGREADDHTEPFDVHAGRMPG